MLSSLFTHPHVILKPVWFPFLVRDTKEDILKVFSSHNGTQWGPKTILAPTDFHCIDKKKEHHLFWSTVILDNMRVSKWWFWGQLSCLFFGSCWIVLGYLIQKGKFCHHYSPLSCTEPVWVSFNCWTRKKIFLRMFVTKQFTVPIDFHSMGEKNTMEVNGCRQLFGY